MIEITMSQLDESATEGTITSWLKAVGERIEIDENICDVSTDKVSFEVPAPKAGILTEIVAPEGTIVPVGGVIARLDFGGRQAPEPAKAYASRADTAAAGASSPRRAAQRFSPIVRRLAREHGVELPSMTGTGQGGRVTRDDLLRVVQTAAADNHASGRSMPALSGTPTAGSASRAEEDHVIPFTPVRRRTAEHMVHSLAVSPHGYISFEVDYGASEAVRTKHKAAFAGAHGVNLNYLPFVLRAVTGALRKYPLINSSVGDGELIVRAQINIGIAVDLAYEGLIVPVIPNADRLTLAGLAIAIADSALRARTGKLGADALTGGTFTVTNPGPSGTHLSVPIINQPQAAILVTDGVERKPAMVTLPDGSESIAIRPIGRIGLSMDHRAFDSAYAADFLCEIKKRMEEDSWGDEL